MEGKFVVAFNQTKGQENEKNSTSLLTISGNSDMHSGLNAQTTEKVLPHFARFWQRLDLGVESGRPRRKVRTDLW